MGYKEMFSDYNSVSILIVQPNDDEDQQEKALSQLYDYVPEGVMILTILKDKVQRKQLGNCQSHPANV